MPWPRNEALPASVKGAGYDARGLTAFRNAANAALARGEKEEAAMKIGHAAAKAIEGSEANAVAMNERIRGRG